MKCTACNHEDTQRLTSFQEIFVLVHESQYLGVPTVDGKQVHLFACPKCGTVRMEK